MTGPSTDPVLHAARQNRDEALTALEDAIAGLDAEALDWRPAPDANSLAVLAMHALHSTRSWLAPIARDCRRLLDRPPSVDWAAARRTDAGPGGETADAPAAWALLHALEHLREHVGQMLLTRQLWLARPG